MSSPDHKPRIVLASNSPRRRELLHKLGIKFIVAAPTSSETSTASDPREMVIENAKSKAYSVSPAYPDSLIIAADTVIYLDNVIIGKPSNPEDAVKTLETLSGKPHMVYMGVVVLDTRKNRLFSGLDVTRVKFRKLTSIEIKNYVDGGEPLDKAGSYAIQGEARSFIEWIDGSWSNVVGLPLGLLTRLLDAAYR